MDYGLFFLAESMTHERYTPSEIEPKWQAYWDEHKTFATSTDLGKPKKYVLDMFPYPSGAGLHVGHPEGYTATDIICRALRAQGYAVLHPMGWDAFGLPAEQYAIQTGVHPRVTTEKNINTFRRQIKALGLSYDWDREVDTTDPAYVKWTQWIFLQLFKRGLAYQTEKPVNWCPALGTVLANEEVIDGKSERGQHPVVRLPLRQWMLKITAYADRLAADLDQVKWPDSTKTMQEEWIGRSEGAEVIFQLDGHEGQLEVFTTRPDTLFGATFMVVAPEHPVVEQITTADRKAEVEAYVAAAKNRSELDRRAAKEKTGVFTGAYAINPVNGAKVPVWTADYVLWGYGTGAIMAVPAHDERDFAFATKFGIPVIEVVSATGTARTEPLTEAFCEEGLAVNSGAYDGLKTADFKKRITEDLNAKGQGSLRVEYKLRDWVFSRQRYWGEPFPIYFPVTCEGDPRQGGDFTIHYETPIALEESELPLLLPEMEDFSPGDDPAGCLARATDWRFFERDGKWFARETNTMPQWAGSCWYYLRYIDPKNPEAAWSKEAADRWLPVDLYVGGAEHAVLHLLYARFWHKVLFDCGHVTAPEPFTRLVHQGMILGEVEYTRFFTMDGQPVSKEQVSFLEGGGLRHKATGEDLKSERVSEELITKKGTEFVMKDTPEIVIDGRAFKMSKSRGNVINPDDVIQAHGADALRLYEMFMGPLEAAKPWSTGGIQGVSRFLDRVWAIGHRDRCEEVPDALLRLTHKTIQKVTQDIETLGMNTAISALMIYINELPKDGPLPRFCVETLLQLVHPFAPHIAEELWERLGHQESIQLAPWPTFDPALCVASEVEVPVQVNGKVRGKLLLPVGTAQADAQAAALADTGVQKHLEGKQLVKVIWVQDKLMSLVVK